MKVTATDQEGNKSLVTTINVIDTTPPKAPSVLPLTSENVEISVVGEPGSTIKILLPDNTELIGQADNQGVSVIALPGNKNSKVEKDYELPLQMQLEMNHWKQW